MFRLYVEAGFDPVGFWELSPRGFMIVMEGAGARLRQSRQVAIEAAWITAILGRAQTIPDLHQLLEDEEERDPEEIAAEQRAKLRTFSSTLPSRTWEEWRQRR